MLTGEQYRATLDDGRATYFEGERVDDIPNHPIMGVAADVVADCYDRFYSADADAQSPLVGIPKSAQELKERIPLLHSADMLAHVTYSSIMTLITAGGRLPDMPVYNERIQAYVADMQAQDRRITQCITDAKGDRGLPPGKQPDPDSYCRVVERRDDGVV
ncbi:MAG: 4-hydroxyphenylacetate 3-hydroxylase, partial [Rhodospirillaceae bacterium]|nr:4-hydroxyphenylacetate 3-hydroxylase [Rhodospirillaceae bacterium]